ncbi:hypothetical protein ACOME3_000857 [Neoechinorhynchus agilis]
MGHKASVLTSAMIASITDQDFKNTFTHDISSCNRNWTHLRTDVHRFELFHLLSENFVNHMDFEYDYLIYKNKLQVTYSNSCLEFRRSRHDQSMFYRHTLGRLRRFSELLKAAYESHPTGKYLKGISVLPEKDCQKYGLAMMALKQRLKNEYEALEVKLKDIKRQMEELHLSNIEDYDFRWEDILACNRNEALTSSGIAFQPDIHILMTYVFEEMIPKFLVVPKKKFWSFAKTNSSKLGYRCMFCRSFKRYWRPVS